MVLPAPGPDEDDVAFAGVAGQRELLRSGRLTAVELLAVCLRRIERWDRTLGAFRVLFPESAGREAEAADAALAAGDRRELLGVPVAVKDNLAVAGHAPSQGTGSPEPVAAGDSEVVRRLRAAGAVIIGATRLPELALWPFTESATWGATRNPWSPAHTPGGSSGGSAAAVAAGLVAAAHATDGGGSIRIPAACCALVGLKPQRDRVPMDEHWYGLSHTGCLTRTVADTVIMLGVLSGTPIEIPAPRAYRIAWSVAAPVPTTVHRDVRQALDGTVELLRGLGHDVFQADPDYKGVQASFLARFAGGAAQDLERLADRDATEPRTRAVARLGTALPPRALAAARAAGARAGARLAVLPQGADVLLTPVLAAPPGRVGAMTGLTTLAKAGRTVPFTPAWNVTGQPALSLPAGWTADGLPLAVQLVGRPDGEGLLLALAAQVEAATGFAQRRPPLGVAPVG